MNWILILIGIAVGLALVCLWLYYMWKNRKIKNQVPDDVIQDFEEAERRYRQYQKDGTKKSGEQIIKEIVRERRAKADAGADAEMDRINNAGKPKLENPVISEQLGAEQHIQDGIAAGIVKPVAESSPSQPELTINKPEPVSTIGTTIRKRGRPVGSFKKEIGEKNEQGV